MVKFLNREASHPINPLFLSRVSSRAFSEVRLQEEELMTLFEAARWAPSARNEQPWRFVYGRRGEEEWPLLFDLLVDSNKVWCMYADTLVLITSRSLSERDGSPSITSHFSSGAAWMSLAIQANFQGVIAHAMGGFDYEKARKTFQIGDQFAVEAMVAIGKPGSPDYLPKDLQEREVPSLRKGLDEIVSKGKFIFK